MRRYSFLGRRILHVIPVLFGITVITFFLLRLIPGDPARQILGQHYTPASGAALRHALGLDRPLWHQYVLFMKRLFHGNLGDSISTSEPATHGDLRPLHADAVPRRLRGGDGRDHLDPDRHHLGAARGGVFDQTARVLRS